jgi:hypothetical protein
MSSPVILLGCNKNYHYRGGVTTYMDVKVPMGVRSIVGGIQPSTRSERLHNTHT